MIYLVYGQPGSGKSQLSKRLATHLNLQWIDEDIVARMFGDNTDFDNIEEFYTWREMNFDRLSIISTYLNLHINVVCSAVCPYQSFRDILKENNDVFEIYLYSDRDTRRQHHIKDFDIGKPMLKIDTTDSVHNTFNALVAQLDRATDF